MKHFLSFLLISLVLISCSEEPVPNPESDLRLASISYTDNRSDQFMYNTEGKINEVVSTFPYGESRKVYEYNNSGYLNQILTFDESSTEPYAKDVIVYNSQNAISNIYRYNLTNGQFQLNSTIKPTYGSNNLPKELLYTYEGSPSFQSKQMLYWNEGNLIKVENYDGENQLLHEFFYEYDNHPNFKLSNPFYINAPESSSKNNLVKMDYNDYTGLLDTFCKPCTYSYEYNEEGLPTKVKHDSFESQNQNIFYEDGNAMSESIWLCGTTAN